MMRTFTTIATLVAVGALATGCAHDNSTPPPATASNTSVDMSRSPEPTASSTPGTGYDQAGYGATAASSGSSTTGQTGATQAMPQSGSTNATGSGSTSSTSSTNSGSSYPSSNAPSSNTTGATESQTGSGAAPSTMGSTSTSSATGSADATSGTAFPTTQGNGPMDKKITAAVRRALSNDKALSAFARNVTVISNGGRVVLTGTVKNENERTLIETKARQVDGVTDVDNRLELAGNPDKNGTSGSTTKP